MASQDLQLSVVLRAVNHLSGPLRNAMRSIEDLDRVAKQTKGLRAMANDLDALSGGLTRLGGLSLGAGLGAAFGLGLTDVPGQAIAAQHSLRAIGNTAGLTRQQLAFARTEIRGLSRDVNQLSPEMVGALGLLTAAGLDFEISLKALRPIGKTATAEVAALADVSATAFSVLDNLNVPVSQLQMSLDVLAQAGKEGRFELANMARFFPQLTAAARGLEMEGVSAVASLGAALQIAMKGAGSPEQAANNLANFLSKLTSPETVRNFQKMGVDIRREFASWGAAGKDPILEAVKLVERLTGGNQFDIGNLFGDQQVLNFLRPMVQNLEEFQRIKRVSLDAKGVIDADFLNMMTTTQEQWKLLRTNLAATFGGQIQGPLAALNTLLTKLNENPALQNLILGGVGASIAFGGAALALAGVGAVGSGALKTVAGAIDGAAALRAGWAGAAQSLEGGQKIVGALGGGLRRLTGLLGMLGGKALSGTLRAFGLLATGLRIVTVATWSFTAALLANPITWIILGIVALAGAVFLIYRNWGTIAAFFTGVWDAVKGAFGAALEWITNLDLFQAGANLLGSLWEGMKSAVGRIVDLAGDVAQQIRDFWPFSPARVGPLRDLHRVRIIETVADTIRPAPLVRAMRTATAAALMAVPGAVALPVSTAVARVPAATPTLPAPVRAAPALPAPAPLPSPLPRRGSEAAGRAASGAPVVQFHYAPVYNLSPAENADLIRQLQEFDVVQRAELRRFVERIVQEAWELRDRTRYQRGGQ